MWKWILGAIGAVLLILVVGVCSGIRKVQNVGSGPSETTTMIGATPARVFASLANGDSIPDWMVTGRVRPSRHGILRVGDTLHVTQTERLQGTRFIVSEVAAGKSFAIQVRDDSVGVVMVVRRYALEARGDSTALITTVTSPVLDSSVAAAAAKTDAGAGRAMLGLTVKLMLGAMRMQSQVEVNELKARVEGRQVAPGARTP